MTRVFASIVGLLCSAYLAAQPVTIVVRSKGNEGKPVLLYRYDDLFSLRCSRIGTSLLSDSGTATLEAEVQGTAKLRLRIGEVFGDLYARPDARYQVEFPETRSNRGLSGTQRVDLLFNGLDPLDVNALTSDLNGRIDAFISEDLATDQVAGMQALEVQRTQKGSPTDTVAHRTDGQRPATLFVTPTWSELRVDSFENRVRHFYRDVHDTWFDHYLMYSFAGLRYGPRVNERELFERYLKDRPVLYDDPEYVRFIRSFFSEQLWLARTNSEATLQNAFNLGEPDSLRALLARNEFLKNDDRLCELVMIDLLHEQYHSKSVMREGADRILEKLSANSRYAEHRPIAANMLWDLTNMRVGSRMPAMLLETLSGKETPLDTLLSGPVCIVFTASWCSYCDLEMQGFEQLHTEYGKIVPIVAIALDSDLEQVRKYVKSRPAATFTWLHALADQQLRDDLRIKSLPSVFLLNDGVLARSPAPLPSQGLGALFHQARVAAENGAKVKVWDD